MNAEASAARTSDVLFVGLPATGKTTYLALLYRAILSRKAATLRLGGFKDDRQYINEIVAVLASCTVADHTTVDQRKQLTLSLRNDSQDVYLSIPDMSGESWEHALLDRGWTTELDRRVKLAEGFVIFVHADQIDTQPTIAQINAGVAALAGNDEPEVNVPDPAGDKLGKGIYTGIATVQVRRRATQVSIVDLLQLLSSHHSRPVRVSLVISAWDLVTAHETPESWVEKNLPLLQQFIDTSTGWLALKVWGVSAQGGDFGNPQSKQELLPKDVVDRSLIRAPDGQNCAVDDPVVWVLGLK